MFKNFSEKDCKLTITFFFQQNENTLESNIISTFDDSITVHSIAIYKVSNNDWGHLY